MRVAGDIDGQGHFYVCEYRGHQCSHHSFCDPLDQCELKLLLE